MNSTLKAETGFLDGYEQALILAFLSLSVLFLNIFDDGFQSI